MQIVIRGNPVDGFKFYGPYPDRDAAIRAGEESGDGDWWIAPVIGESYSPEWDDSFGEHPVYDIADWRADVAAGDTKLSYRQWVAHNLESEKA